MSVNESSSDPTAAAVTGQDTSPAAGCDWLSAQQDIDDTTRNQTRIPQDVNSPYFHYVQDYTRTGRY